MARVDSSRTASPAPTADAGALFDEWLKSQQRLLGVSMDQWTELQSLWLRSWRQQWDAWAALWQTEGTAAPQGLGLATAGVPANYWEAMQRASTAWWGPWQPLFQRGGEQLA